MSTLTTTQILSNILNEIPFEGTTEDGALYIKIGDYVPYMGIALHQGHQMAKHLEPLCLLSQEQRYHEEDPLTGEMIASLPIVLIAQDSRYEYDLNRVPSDCIYDEAWGAKVWKRPLTEEEIKPAIRKFHQFYTLLNSLIKKIIELHDGCLIFDIHAYNVVDRDYRDPPLFNVGTEFVDKSRFGKIVNAWKKNLKKADVPNTQVTVKENEIYNGEGYLPQWVASHFSKCLVLSTEIKKMYADEVKQKSYPLVMDALKESLTQAILSTALKFAEKSTSIQEVSKQQLLFTGIDKTVKELDRQLFQLAKGMNSLYFVSPVNLISERKQFFKNKFHSNPQFHYKHLHINPYRFKEKLYRLPVDDIKDLTLAKIYRATIDSLAVKIEMLASVGQPNFLYNSLKYYGEPSENDIKNAKFILHLHEEPHDMPSKIVGIEHAVEAFKQAALDYNIDLKIEVSNKIVAKALVNNTKKAVLLNKNLSISERELTALIHHELGIHIITTYNAVEQPLKLLRIGLPFNTLTQEGLAILSEHLCDRLSVKRLKILALRVIAVSLMLKGYEFKKVFMTLYEDYGVDTEEAFVTTTRIFRGGGFTKDYLYLRGFKLAYKHYKSGANLLNLLIGKTSFEYQQELSELIERGILKEPKYKTVTFLKPTQENAVTAYLVNAIR